MKRRGLIITMLIIAAAVFIAVPVTADTGIPVPDTDSAILAVIIAAGFGLGIGLIGQHETLSSRAIIGWFYNQLEVLSGMSWVDPISMYVPSDQAMEEYLWLGMSPAMREWVGGRHAKGLREYGMTVRNKDYEATLEVLRKDLSRDKTRQIMIRISELAARTVTHWASLLSTLIVNGETGECYDGQYFFDDEHAEGNSGTQSNLISVDISGLPVSVSGTTTAPSPEEFSLAVLKAVEAILGYCDDQGEPMNELANKFLVMVPVSLLTPATLATSQQLLGHGGSNILGSTEFQISVKANPRLSSWTNSFAVFRTDGQTKPFIRQEEEGVEFNAIAEGSELEFKERKHWYGVSASRNVGYAYWQHACKVTLE